MENAYGIGVKNRYELFYDEDVDPLEIIRQQQEEKEKRKTDKSLPKDKSTKPGKSAPATGVSKKPKDTSSLNPPKLSETNESANKPRSRPFTDRAKNRSFDDSTKDLEERKNFRNREDHGPPNSDTRERDSEMRRGRGGFRGRGRPRGRGGFFNNYENRPPRREFDRHSGTEKTGMRSIEKMDGGSSNNWSDVKSEFSARKKETVSTWMEEDYDASGVDKQGHSNWGDPTSNNIVANAGKVQTVVEKSGDDTPAENIEAKENVPVLEESTKEMTLDEWKREQEAKRAVPKYNLRKPGEGEDGNQWKKLYVLKKKAKETEDDDDDDEEEDDEEEDVEFDELSRRGRQRLLVDIQINFNDSRRGRGRGRGTRGAGLRSERSSTGGKDILREESREPVTGPSVGRSFRGSMKINRSGQQSAPRVDDWNDFPSLLTS